MFDMLLVLIAAAAQAGAVTASGKQASEASAAPPPTDTTAPVSMPHRAPPGYDLVFADEFNAGNKPDPSKWNYDRHRNAKGWFNNELQYYAANRSENARVENGRLIIEARHDGANLESESDYGGQEYSSVRLLTQGKAAWTYGFYEIRAKLPCGRGTWPAIWMLPEDSDVVWPDGGEIDIMEHVGYDPMVIHHSVHTKAFNFGRGTQKTTSHNLDTACTQFHRYHLLWTPDGLIFGVDDAPKFAFRKLRSGNSRWPFDEPMYLILNVAIGGDWGGRKGIDESALPQRMEIDHVRVYQLVEE